MTARQLAISNPSDPHRVARLATMASAAILALASGVQMLVFLGTFGTSAATDGALGAYSLYILITVFAQACRVSASAAIGGSTPRLTVAELSWGFATVSAVLIVGTALLRSPLSYAVASGAEATDAAADFLPILGLGMAAQFAAVLWATVLGQRGGLTWAASSLAVGAICGLVGFLLLVPAADQNALAWATVISSTVACSLMAARTRGIKFRRAKPSGAAGAVLLVLRENLVPMFSTALYAMSVGVAAQVADQAGTVSLFALAFLAASYICGILGWSTAIVDTVSLGDAAGSLGERLRVVVPAGIALPFPLAAAVLATGILAGPAAIDLIAPPDTAGGDPQIIAYSLAILVPFTFATLALNIALSSWVTSGAVRQLNGLVLGLLVLHLAVSAAAGLVAGVLGVACATMVAPAMLCAAALRPSNGLAARVAVRALGVVVLAVLTFGTAGVLLGALLSDDAIAAGAAVLTGAAAYAAAVRQATRRTARTRLQ